MRLEFGELEGREVGLFFAMGDFPRIFLLYCSRLRSRGCDEGEAREGVDDETANRPRTCARPRAHASGRALPSQHPVPRG